jgi:hypothetical protein
MNRRHFLRSSCAACAGLAFTKSVPVFADNSLAGGWRTFEVTTSVELLQPSGVSRIWLPTALIRDTPYQRMLSNNFTAEDGTVKLSREKQNMLGIVSATYPAGRKARLSLTSRVLSRTTPSICRRPHKRRTFHTPSWSTFFGPAGTCQRMAL